MSEGNLDNLYRVVQQHQLDQAQEVTERRALAEVVSDLVCRVSRLQGTTDAIPGRLQMIEEDVENLENTWGRGASAERRLAALESHVTPIPRLMGDIEKLRKDHELLADRVWGKLIDYVDNMNRCVARSARHDREIVSLKMELAKIISATVRLFPRGDAPDLLSFLVYCDGSLDCSPDGEMRLIFPEGAPVPLSDLMTAASLLWAHDSKGRIEVSYEGGTVVRLRPPPKGASE